MQSHDKKFTASNYVQGIELINLLKIRLPFVKQQIMAKPILNLNVLALPDH
jgi:hypothetical protein